VAEALVVGVALGAEEVAFRVQLVTAMVRRAAVIPISIRDVTRADLSPADRQASGDAPSLPTAASTVIARQPVWSPARSAHPPRPWD
jgi:hypothetical protein